MSHYSMSADAMAEAIAYELSKDGIWKAEFDGLGEIKFENEDGERFLITVEQLDEQARS